MDFFRICLEGKAEVGSEENRNQTTESCGKNRVRFAEALFITDQSSSLIGSVTGTRFFSLPIHNPFVFAYFMRPTHMRMWRNWQTR